MNMSYLSFPEGTAEAADRTLRETLADHGEAQGYGPEPERGRLLVTG